MELVAVNNRFALYRKGTVAYRKFKPSRTINALLKNTYSETKIIDVLAGSGEFSCLSEPVFAQGQIERACQEPVRTKSDYPRYWDYSFEHNLVRYLRYSDDDKHRSIAILDETFDYRKRGLLTELDLMTKRNLMTLRDSDEGNLMFLLDLTKVAFLAHHIDRLFTHALVSRGMLPIEQALTIQPDPRPSVVAGHELHPEGSMVASYDFLGNRYFQGSPRTELDDTRAFSSYVEEDLFDMGLESSHYFKRIVFATDMSREYLEAFTGACLAAQITDFYASTSTNRYRFRNGSVAPSDTTPNSASYELMQAAINAVCDPDKLDVCEECGKRPIYKSDNRVRTCSDRCRQAKSDRKKKSATHE